MMSRDDPPPTEPTPTALVLPRPNLGPEPWSEPPPVRGWTGLVVGSILAVALLGLALRRRQVRLRRATAASQPDLTPGAADLTPSDRLIASSTAVRVALIAEFGPTWGARTTEEIALDPTLPDRLGPENAERIVAYLRQVDRAKFAGEELVDVDEWIDSARGWLDAWKRLPPRRAT